MKAFRLTAEAAADISEIFGYIVENSIDAAQHVISEIYDQMNKLVRNPQLGHKRRYLTSRELLFWPVYSYLVIYQPNTKPINIIALLHGSRDVKKVLNKR